MKKRLAVLAIIVSSFSIYATQNVGMENGRDYLNMQSEYTEISLASIPKSVKVALVKAYPGATIVKAFINNKKEYRIEISVEGQNATVDTDAEGNWLKY